MRSRHGSNTQQALATMAALLPGEKGRVVALECKGLPRRRLLDLGLTPGVEVQAIMRAALGDPVAYRVRDTLMALRREQAEQILVHRLDDAGGCQQDAPTSK